MTLLIETKSVGPVPFRLRIRSNPYNISQKGQLVIEHCLENVQCLHVGQVEIRMLEERERTVSELTITARLYELG